MVSLALVASRSASVNGQSNMHLVVGSTMLSSTSPGAVHLLTPVYFLRLPFPPSSSMLAFTNRDLISARSETAKTFALVLVTDVKYHN